MLITVEQWVLDSQFMHSDVDGVTGTGFLGDISFIQSQGVQHILRATYIDDEFDMNDLGFLTRNSQVNLDYNFTLTESDIPGIQSRTTVVSLINNYNIDGNPVQNGQSIGRTWNYLNNDTFDATLLYLPERIDIGRRKQAIFIFPSDLVCDLTDSITKSIAWSLNLEATQEDLGPKIITSGAGIGVLTINSRSISGNIRI